MSPLTVRLRFKLRPLTNYAFVFVVFAALAVIIAEGVHLAGGSALWAWALDGAVILLLFYWFSFFLDKRAIRSQCPSATCGKVVASNMPWICGFSNCNKINQRIDEFPFNRCCEHCGAEPKAYQCPHCSTTVFLTDEQLSLGCARFVDASPQKKRTTVDSGEQHEKLKQRIIGAKLRKDLAKEKQDLKELTKPKRQREIDLQAMMDTLQGKSEKRQSLTTWRRGQREKVIGDDSLSDEEKKLELEEIDRVVEEAKMLHF
jgi:hypothetical protein